MKQFKYLLLMLMALLSFSACESEDDNEIQGEGGMWEYLSISNVKCERIGNCLRVEFKLKNVSGKNLNDISIQNIKAVDNTSNAYNYSGNKMSIEGGLFQKPLYGLDNISLKKGEEKSATIVIDQFDPSNNAKNAKLCLDVYIGESEKGYLSGETRFFGWTDERPMTGIQTNDKILSYSNSSCTYRDGSCYWTFYVTSKVSISDFHFKWSSSNIADNTGEKCKNFDVSFDDGKFLDDIAQDRASTNLIENTPKKITVKFKNFQAQARSISGSIFINAASYPLTCDYLVFNNIQVVQ